MTQQNINLQHSNCKHIYQLHIFLANSISPFDLCLPLNLMHACDRHLLGDKEPTCPVAERQVGEFAVTASNG